MKFKYQGLLTGTVLILLLVAGCKKEDKVAHNSSSPIVVSSFVPAIGGSGTEVLINGSNFTTDISQLSVTLNGKKLRVIGANTKQIMVVISKRAGSGPIIIKIGAGTATTATNFTYQFIRRVSTLAGSGVAGYADGQGADAKFDLSSQNWYRSSGIVTDSKLNVYVADPGNHCIRKIDSLGNVSTFAGSPNSGYADGKGAAAKFSLPYGLAIDNNDNIYCVDPGNWDIRKISPDGNAVTIAWANASPWYVAVDKKTGYVYHTSNANPATIYQITPSGTNSIITGLFYPGGLIFDSTGNLYSTINQTVKKFAAGTWTPSTIAGQEGQVGYVDTAGTAAKFATPFGISIDANNNFYVGENGTWDGSPANPDQSIRFIDGKTFWVSTFAGSATAGFTNGVGKLASFNAPIGVTVDKNGTVYVLDKNNNSIRKIVSE